MNAKQVTNLGKLITRKHERKWVAVSKDYKKVVAFDKSLISLEKKVGKKEVMYMKIPPSDVFFSGTTIVS